MKNTQKKPDFPVSEHPVFITITDFTTRKSLNVMLVREAPKFFENGYIQPEYQMKEEELYIKNLVHDLQQKNKDKMYFMYSGVSNSNGRTINWWKIIYDDVIKMKFYYRNKIGKHGNINIHPDKDKFLHSDDGMIAINNIDSYREKFAEIGVSSKYINPFVVEFDTGKVFSDEELDVFRNAKRNAIKTFEEWNSPKNLDTDYKTALNFLSSKKEVMLHQNKNDVTLEMQLLTKSIFNLRLLYHEYCNGVIKRLTWQDDSCQEITVAEVCLQEIIEYKQNLIKLCLDIQEGLEKLKPSL